MPSAEEWRGRLRSVLHVLYLIFNEGYLTSTGAQLARSELSGEAIRLARIAHKALPEDPEVAGLLALMLLTEARRPARSTATGELVPLAEQDRTMWERELIVEGDAMIVSAFRRGAIGEYQLQAAIAATHDRAARPEDTDWREILALYGLLERIAPSPIVTLNRAIAVAMADGPEAGLALLAELDGVLSAHHRLHAARAHMLEMAGDTDAAIACYRTAAELTTNLPEQHYLLRRAAGLGESEGPPKGCRCAKLSNGGSPRSA
jgi:predicted RNA polymerase sigma factor